MSFTIPLTAIAAQSFSVTLDDEQFRLRIIWNSREESWRLDISDDTDVRLVSGLKIVPNRVLNSEYQGAKLPKGFLLAISSAPKVKPTFDSLGTTLKLTYVTEQEIRNVPV